MAKDKGNYYSLWVKAGSVPSTPSTIGEYTLVGNRKGTGLNMSASSVDTTDSGEQVASNIPGIPTATITGTFNADHVGDAGILILKTAIKTGAQVHWLLTPIDSANAQQAGKLQHYGTGSPTECSYTHGHESPSEVSIGIDVDGQFTTDLVAT